MKAILLIPYQALSHQYWAKALVRMCPNINWQVYGLPARHFSWRIRGNPLAYTFDANTKIDCEDLDLIVATSMTDLATLVGINPCLQGTPSLLYFHENQFAYPTRTGTALEAQMVTLYSALAATKVVFNSEYNRRTYLAGIEQMLRAFPDHQGLSSVAEIREKSNVLPVPLNGEEINATVSDVRGKKRGATADSENLLVLWNHRWEYDKGPERLHLVLERLYRGNYNCRFVLLGQQFRQLPPELVDLDSKFPGMVIHHGFVEQREKYLGWLALSDVVLSTALHDFQGLAVLEAVARGCIPLVPNRLAYAEFFADEFLYPSEVRSPAREADSIVGQIIRYIELKSRGKLPRAPDVTHLEDQVMAQSYQAAIAGLFCDNV